jgi:hypothetical protein
MRCCAAFTALAMATASLAAQSDPPNRLTGIRRLTCQFTAAAGGAWQNGEAQARVKTTGTLRLEITSIDTDDGSAEVSGGASPHAHVVAQLRGWTLHFLDAEPDGGLNVTTVFSQETRPRRLKAVHTRTKYLPISVPGFEAEPEVSQYYGECEIGQ